MNLELTADEKEVLLLVVDSFMSELRGHVSPGVSDDLLLDSVTAFQARVDEAEQGGPPEHTRPGVTSAFLLREEVLTVSDDQSEVPGAGGIDPRIVDLIEYAVAGREPDRTF